VARKPKDQSRKMSYNTSTRKYLSTIKVIFLALVQERTLTRFLNKKWVSN